jgi:hypothetical protein
MPGKELDISAVNESIAQVLEKNQEALSMPNKIKSLHSRNLGRAISHQKNNIDYLLGYILPLNQKQSKHLVLFNDGRIFVTIPSEKLKKEEYINNFKPNATPFRLDSLDINLVQNTYLFGAVPKCKVILKSDEVSHKKIEKLTFKALKLSQELKRERELLELNNANIAANTIDLFLNYQQAEKSNPRN